MTAKPGLTASKVMLSVWWDWKGIVYYEILEPGQTVGSVLYCQQLTRLQEAIKKKRPELVNRKGVVFHHDKARPHTSLMTRQKLTELVGKFWCTHCTARTLRRLNIICFGLCKTSLMEKNWPTKEQPKTMSPSFSPVYHRSSIPMELWNCPKNGKRSRIIMAHM